VSWWGLDKIRRWKLVVDTVEGGNIGIRLNCRPMKNDFAKQIMSDDWIK
jgi:hypothetical protein